MKSHSKMHAPERKKTRFSILAKISVAAIVVAAPAVVMVGTSSASATSTGTLTITGHGWGHGRGGGQWGAFGYAVEGGWSANQILSHYFSNTHFSTVANSNIRVVMTENDGNPIIVTDAAPFTVANVSFAAGATARMIRLSTGSWEIDSLNPGTGSGCNVSSAAWTSKATVAEAQAVALPPTTAYSTETFANALQLCTPVRNEFLRGQIVAADYMGSPRTVNVVDVEDYLRGVVPSESPSYWGTMGPMSSLPTGGSVGPQPAGFQSLMVQAVEARSYALSTPGQYVTAPGGPSYADICDSTQCQVYLGMNNESTVTDQAIAATAGEVMLMDSTNAIARAEYSASTGGWTYGGTFPAVIDQYDNVCITNACNPNHDWTTTLPISSIEAMNPSIGTLTGIDVTARNGLGSMGGRVESLNLVGTTGTVSLYGYSFEYDFGLKSDWFSFSGPININNNSPTQSGSTTSGAATGPGNGYLIDNATGGVETFGDAASYGSMAGKYLYKPLVGMASTPNGQGYWMVASDGGIFTFGNAGFYGSMGGKPLNKPIVGMAATPNGQGYWMVASDGGVFAFGNAGFYGSMGGKPLNQPIVGMAATPDGKGYWLVAADGGIFSFGDAAFYGSMGGKPLNKPIDGMAATADGRGYWLVASDGGIFTFGDATFYGSLGGKPISNGAWATSFSATKDGLGYYILDSLGRVYTFGDAKFMGDPNTSPGWQPVTYTGITVTP
ncbi:MAG: hypothetical protein M1288_01315 [Actinobacteria bacterium]|nr:hypothetical protein [Actinomycetota bacterium]